MAQGLVLSVVQTSRKESLPQRASICNVDRMQLVDKMDKWVSCEDEMTIKQFSSKAEVIACHLPNK